MNLVSELREKADSLPEGDYTLGLKAVLIHIDGAANHHRKGKQEPNDSLFTDSIYRCNQAFEGIIKEAYRVLASADPSRKGLAEIENYLESRSVLRERVLKEFTRYRRDWRNPSTHDYKLDFDKDEALLAITQVTALAICLMDQIDERVAFNRSMKKWSENASASNNFLINLNNCPITESVSDIIIRYCQEIMEDEVGDISASEAKLIGELHGCLKSMAPDFEIDVDSPIRSSMGYRADLVVRAGDQELIIEVKRAGSARHYEGAIQQLERCIGASGVQSAMLLILPQSRSSMKKEERHLHNGKGRLIIISPS